MGLKGSELEIKPLSPLFCRYFFKKATEEEFGREVPHVLEEITNDNAILPKWESKVVGHLKKVE